MTPELPHTLPPPPAPPDLPVAERDALFAALADATVDRHPTLRSRLAEQPWAVRTGLAAAAIAALGIGLAWASGLRTEPTATLPALVLAGAAAGLGAGSALRPAGWGPHPLHTVAAALPLLLPLFAAVMPMPGMHGPAPHGASAMHVTCGVFGLITASAAGGLTAWLDPGAPGRLQRALGAAGAGGATGFVATTLHCPWADPVHLALAHGGAGVLVGAVLVSLRLRPRPRLAGGSG